MKPLGESHAMHFVFRTVYQQFLQILAAGDMTILKQMCEPSLYAELHEFREENVTLNDATLTVENADTTDFKVYASEIKFVGGLHIDRQKNVKELMYKYKGEYD